MPLIRNEIYTLANGRKSLAQVFGMFGALCFGIIRFFDENLENA